MRLVFGALLAAGALGCAADVAPGPAFFDQPLSAQDAPDDYALDVARVPPEEKKQVVEDHVRNEHALDVSHHDEKEMKQRVTPVPAACTLFDCGAVPALPEDFSCDGRLTGPHCVVVDDPICGWRWGCIE